jgi:hypothetical protein
VTVIDPNEHMENEWGIDANPFPAEGISNKDDEPWADLYPDEVKAFDRKFVRGGVRGGPAIGFLWSQGPSEDTGFGKTRLIRQMRDRINADLGADVLTGSGLKADRIVKVAAAYTNLKSGVAMGLFPVVHAAVADLGIAHGGKLSVLDRARTLVIQKIAARDQIALDEVTGTMIANEVRRVRLETAPTGSPLRVELLEGFAAGGVDMQQAIAQASDALKLRAGIVYLDFALAALKAAGIERLFLFVDQLEDLANNRTLTKAKRDREVGRIRDLQEEEPYASQLRMVLTFHSTAAAALAEFWIKHRLPSFEAIPANDSAVVVLRGITSDEDGAELLRVYLDAARVSDVADDLVPFEPDAVTELLAQSQGRIGILLGQAHKVLDAAARQGRNSITAAVVSDTLGATTTTTAPTPSIATGDDVDDLLLA